MISAWYACCFPLKLWPHSLCDEGSRVLHSTSQQLCGHVSACLSASQISSLLSRNCSWGWKKGLSAENQLWNTEIQNSYWLAWRHWIFSRFYFLVFDQLFLSYTHFCHIHLGQHFTNMFCSSYLVYSYCIWNFLNKAAFVSLFFSVFDKTQTRSEIVNERGPNKTKGQYAWPDSCF